MTDDKRVSDLLEIYAELPIEDGDALLLLDSRVCVEVERMADEWDDELCTQTAELLRQTASTVVLAIARRGADLTPADYRMWRELHQALRETAVDLRPVQALPAAA